VKGYADDLDRIEREYKQRMRKSEASFMHRYNETSSRLKSQQVPSSLTIEITYLFIFHCFILCTVNLNVEILCVLKCELD